MESFRGYLREDGNIGIRNHLLIIASVSCANDVVMKIAENIPNSAYITHQHGCGHLLKEDIDQTKRLIVNSACNPNVAACIVVGLGCELFDSLEISEDIRKTTGKIAINICIQKSKGTINAINQGVIQGRKLLELINNTCNRVPSSFSSLTMGIAGNFRESKCNKKFESFIGDITNFLIEEGARVIQGETAELYLDKEKFLSRCSSFKEYDSLVFAFDRIKEKIEKLQIDDYNQIFTKNSIMASYYNKTIENIVEQKILRMGKMDFNEIIFYGDRASRMGLVHMESTMFTPETISGMCSSEAQIVLHISDVKNSCIGSPIAPVIKLSSLTNYLSNDEPVRSFLDDLHYILEGKKTCSEKKFWNTFAVTRIGPST